MKRSRRELSIDMVIHSDIFENNQTRFTFIQKTGISYFYWLFFKDKLVNSYEKVSPRAENWYDWWVYLNAIRLIPWCIFIT